MRVQQRVRLRGHASIDGFAEVFNVFNRANYGAFNVTETSLDFGRPLSSTNLSYAPRSLQLGFRVAF